MVYRTTAKEFEEVMDTCFVIIWSDEGGLKSLVVHHNKSIPQQ
jgi:hypothetical protein